MRESQVYEEKNDYFIDMKVRRILKKYILLMKKIQFKKMTKDIFQTK
ncbi:hypothetical protein [Bacillus sp. FSL R12-0069]